MFGTVITMTSLIALAIIVKVLYRLGELSKKDKNLLDAEMKE